MADVMPEADYDGAWKEAIEAYLPDCLALLFPAIHADIDWSQPIEFLDTELQRVAPQAELGQRIVDKLIKVWRRHGGEVWVLLHIEVQNQQIGNFEERMFRYYARLRLHFHQTVASVVILGDDSSTWRPREYETDLWGCDVRFRFPIVKLLDLQARWRALEASDNPFAGVVMAHVRALETHGDATRRRRAKVELIRWLYSRSYSAEQVRQLFRFIDWLLLLPREVEQLFRSELHAIEEEQHMPYITSVERLAMEEGIERGIERGIEQGKRPGLLMGLELALEVKFGEAGRRVYTDMEQIQDVAVLESVARQLRTSSTLDEVTAVYRHTQP